MNSYLIKLITTIQNYFNYFDTTVEKYRGIDLSLFRQPIFIIGAPRTGSTLLYQTMLGQFHLAYISNAMALLPSVMIKACEKWPRLALSYDGNIRKSRYGFISGIFSPNEAGPLCRKWFEDKGNEEFVRGTFAAIYSITRCPVLIKNLNNSMRLKSIQHVFPGSWFIFIRRDPLFTAQSILLARKKLMGSYEQWWSCRPNGYRRVLDHSPFYQVLWQILTIEKTIQNELNNRLITVQYEKLCQSPSSVMKIIQDKIGLQRRINFSLPDSIKSGNHVRLPGYEWEKLAENYRKAVNTI